MPVKKVPFFVLACLLLSGGAWCAGDEAPWSPEALISRARSQEDLWTAGTPPMLMRAELQVTGQQGAVVRGDYIFYWASPSKWREEIRFANYVRVRVGDEQGYWQSSGLSHQPEVVFQVDKLLNINEVVRLVPNEKPGKVKSHKDAGILQNCTDVKWQSSVERTMCFDAVSGALLGVEYPTIGNQSPPEISRIEYTAFSAIAGKLIPYEVRALKGRNVVAAVKVVEISRMQEGKPGLFGVPDNSEFWARCDDLQQPELVDQVLPKYPEGALAYHEQGRVLVYAVVEADGSVSHAAVIQSVGRHLDAAALDAVGRWHYKPALCGNTPIRMEASMGVDFWLGP